MTGAVTVTGGLLLLVYAIVKAEQAGWASLQTLGLGAIALALLGGFLAWEARQAAPLVRVGIFRIRTLAAANAVMLLVVAGLFAMFFFATIHLQRVLDYSPLDAGVAFVPVSAAILIGSGVSTVLVRRFSARTAGIFARPSGRPVCCCSRRPARRRATGRTCSRRWRSWPSAWATRSCR